MRRAIVGTRLLVMLGLVFAFVATPMAVSAQEVELNSGEYRNGSTSEFSVSYTLAEAVDSDELADTGQSQRITYIVGSVLVLTGIGIIFAMRQKHLAKG